MKKRLSLIILSIIMILSIVGCSNKPTDKAEKSTGDNIGIENMSFEDIVKEANGTKVTFYGWGGDELLNKWLKDIFSKTMKEKYNITMEIVPMDIDQILSQLSGEIQANKKDGSIDMIWINGENFKSAKDNNMLYGPFTEKLENFEKYVDKDSEDVNSDFGYPIKGFEAPYGKAQMVMIADTAKVDSLPKNTDELLKFVKKYEGKVTYPALPDFTGSAFVRNIIYDIVGHKEFLNMKADKAEVKKAIEPALKYLRSLNPYLWNNGETFPESSTNVENMFADGELVLNMTYGAYNIAVNIENGKYTDTTTSFQFDKGTIGNTNFMAIAKNSPNKAGAIVAINEMLSPEMQSSRYDILKTLPVVEYDKLSNEQKESFDKVDLGKGTIPQDELLSKRLPEMPAELVPIIEEIWLEEVVGK